jgi:alpha-glucosidase
MVAPDAASLIENDLVYRLARPLALDDVSWIRPGKSTEEWITSRLLYNVGFVSGLNTDTYRYYIDFAAEYGLQYMMFDAGWSDNDDNTKLNASIDVPGLIAYARSKNVGVISGTRRSRSIATSTKPSTAMPHGARAASCAISWSATTRRWCASTSASHAPRRSAPHRQSPRRLQADRPAARVSQPALARRRARARVEHVERARDARPRAHVPFVRMAAGPMDWEGGSMQNGTKKTFRVVFDQPMNQGTRTQQLAQYVLYESPLQYLAGTPSDYRAAPDFTRVLAAIPTTWDETRAIAGAVGDSSWWPAAPATTGISPP